MYGACFAVVHWDGNVPDRLSPNSLHELKCAEDEESLRVAAGETHWSLPAVYCVDVSDHRVVGSIELNSGCAVVVDFQIFDQDARVTVAVNAVMGAPPESSIFDPNIGRSVESRLSSGCGVLKSECKKEGEYKQKAVVSIKLTIKRTLLRQEWRAVQLDHGEEVLLEVLLVVMI